MLALIVIFALILFGVVANLNMTDSILAGTTPDKGDFLIGTFILVTVFLIAVFALTYKT